MTVEAVELAHLTGRGNFVGDDTGSSAGDVSMDLIPEHLQGQRQLHHAGGSDMSDSSYQEGTLPALRQSSINTEPLTLDSEEIETAKDKAEQVIETVGPEEAYQIFTKDLQMDAGQPITEEEMVRKMEMYQMQQCSSRGEEQAEELGRKNSRITIEVDGHRHQIDSIPRICSPQIDIAVGKGEFLEEKALKSDDHKVEQIMREAK